MPTREATIARSGRSGTRRHGRTPPMERKSSISSVRSNRGMSSTSAENQNSNACASGSSDAAAMTGTSDPQGHRPLLVSFAYGADYYLDAARTLRADCAALGVPCHVVELQLPAGTSWIDACRHKVRFIEECRHRFTAPIWWVDVDSRLLKPLPEM